MRYNEILKEGVKAFLPMYQGVPVLDQDDIVHFITEMETKLGRKDRVTWMCRWHRIWIVNHSEAELEARRKREAREAGQHEPTEPVVSDKLWRRMLSAVGTSITKDEAVREADSVLSSVREFKHYLELPIQAIQNVVWDKQSPDDLLNQFSEIEEEWKASLKENRAVRIQPSDEKIIDFGNGWGWWDLNRGGCRDEAEAMGHCGNGHGSYNETILSLRKQLDDTHLSPHLTFILHDGETLGEMKGRNNEKPAEKYHDMIKSLLLSDYVQDIKGGGYAPENNFALSDLPDEDQDEIKRVKPQLRPAWELWSEYEKAVEEGEEVSDDFMHGLKKKVENEASKFGSYKEIDWDKKQIIVSSRSLSSYTSFTNGVVSKLAELLEGDELGQIIEDRANNDEDRRNADSIAHDVERRFFLPMVSVLLPYDANFRMHAMSARLVENGKEDRVEHYISISDFLYEDDETLQGIDTFDEEYDDIDTDYLNNIDSFADPIERTIWDYVRDNYVKQHAWGGKNKPGGDKDELAAVILDEYGDKDARAKQLNTSGRRVYTPTISDPKQMEFDFNKA